MASARVGIDLARAAIVWLFNRRSGSQHGHPPACLLLRLHVLMQHATAVQFILMSEMENSQATLYPTEGLQLARRKFVIICDIHGGKWSTGDTDAPWSDRALPRLPSHIGVMTDVIWIYKQTQLTEARAANQAGMLLLLHVRRQELLNVMALTYFYQFHLLESSVKKGHICTSSAYNESQIKWANTIPCNDVKNMSLCDFTMSEVWV